MAPSNESLEATAAAPFVLAGFDKSAAPWLHRGAGSSGCASVRRSPPMRAQRAKLKSRRDDMIIAQGKRGTSAALGYGSKMISSFFLRVWRARARRTRRKKEVRWCAPLPRAAAAAALPWATIMPPLPGLRRPEISLRDQPVCATGANHVHSVDAPIARLFHIVHLGRRATDAHRWASRHGINTRNIENYENQIHESAVH